MTPREETLLDFIALRLESMLRRPAIWGSDAAVESVVLQLLEMRRLLLDPASRPSNNTSGMMRRYAAFLSRELVDATAEPLAVQLERQDRSSDLGVILGRFVEEDLDGHLLEVHAAPAGSDAEKYAPHELLDRVKRWYAATHAAEQWRAHQGGRAPVHFVSEGPRP
jgi:hypothetical protein